MKSKEYPLAKHVTPNVPKNRWIVSLSNGETIFEDNIKDAPSAWERLSSYVIKNKLAITKMRVQIGGLEVDLPSNQEGYVQNKKVMSTGAWTAHKLCVGHIQNGMVLLHELGEDRSSSTKYMPDPGPPYSIYSHKGSCNRKCCHDGR